MISSENQIASKRRQGYVLHNAYGDVNATGKRTAIYDPVTRTVKQQRTAEHYGFFPLPPSTTPAPAPTFEMGETTPKPKRGRTNTSRLKDMPTRDIPDSVTAPVLSGDFTFSTADSILKDMPTTNVDVQFPEPPPLPTPPTVETAVMDNDVPVQATTSEPAVPVPKPSAADLTYLDNVEKREMSTQTTPAKKPNLQRFKFDTIEHKAETIVENPRQRPPPITIPKPKSKSKKGTQAPVGMDLKSAHTPSVTMGSPNDSMDARSNTNSVYEEKWAYSPRTPLSQVSSRSGRGGGGSEVGSELSYREQIRQIISKNRADAMATTPRSATGIDFTAPREKMEIDPVDVTLPARNPPAPPAYHTIGGPPSGPLTMTAFRPTRGRRGGGGGAVSTKAKKKKTKKTTKKKKKA